MIVLLILFVISVFFYANAPMVMDKTFMSLNFALMLSALTYFIYYSRQNSAPSLLRVHFRHSLLFIACYLIVFYQRDFDYLIGILDDNMTKYHMLWFDNTVVAKAMALSTMGIISIFCGYSLSCIGYNRKKQIIRQIYRKVLLREEIEKLDCTDLRQSSGEKKINSATLNIDLLVYFCFALLIIYLIFVDKSLLFGGYVGYSGSNSIGVIVAMMQSSMLAIFAVYSYNYKKDNFGNRVGFFHYFFKPLLLLAIYTAIVLMSGTRGTASRMVLLFLVVYLYVNNKHVKYKFLLSFLLLFVIVFSLIGLFRADFASASIDSGVEGLENMESFFPITSELANSVNTLHIAMSYFPSVLSYTYGLTFFIGFGLLVPGLDSFIHSHITSDMPVDSGLIITNLGLGRDDLYGMGTSCVADVYIAMGPIGVCIIFMLLGLFLRWLEVGTFVKDASPYFLVLSFGAFSMFPFVCRGTLPIMFLSWSYGIIQTAIFSLPLVNFLRRVSKAEA